MSEENILINTPCVFGENGNFLLERELGKGGMGGVYLGRDKMLDRPVAVKVMLKEFGSDPEFLERFKKEAQAAARLIHPNIAQIYSYGISEGMPYISMELVAGGSLDQLMSNGGASTDITRVLKICEQVAQALRCAADNGLVHGDIKPENILLDSNGNAKIVDFGLAAMQNDTDEIWGTPYYIAPEKVSKDPVDFRADIYSLGGTLYHALCGVAPFEGDDASSVVRKRFEFIPREPSEIRPDLTPQIDALVMKMLAFDPADRYPTFEALLADFKTVMTMGLSNSQIITAIDDIEGETIEELDTSSSTGSKSSAFKKRKTVIIKKGARGGTLVRSARKASKYADDQEDYDEEESGGNLGLKVFLFVFVIVLVILGVVGGLWFVQRQTEKSNIEKGSAAIRKQIDADTNTLTDASSRAEKIYAESQAFAKEIEGIAPTAAAKLAELYKDTPKASFFANIKPEKTERLVAALNALTHDGTQEKQNPVANSAANDANKPAQAAEGDASAGDAAAAPADEIPMAVKKMTDLWVRAYDAQARALEIVKQSKSLFEKIKTALDSKGYTEELKSQFMSLSTSSKSDIESLNAKMKELKTECGKIKNGIKNLINDEQKKVERENAMLKLKQEAEKKKLEEEERAKKEAEEKAALVESEMVAAKSAFDGIVASGALTRLYWAGAERDLKTVGEGFKTSEAKQHINNIELKKIAMMKSVHDIFIRNIKGGYVFLAQDKKFKNKKVVSVDETKMSLKNKDDSGSTVAVMWQAFYAEHPRAMNELWNKFIRKGRESGNPKLTLKEWADAQLGFALTLKIICAAQPGAAEVSKKCVADVVKTFPVYKDFAKVVFPEVDYSAIEAETASSEL